jgi:hypothetical protein
MLVLRVGRRGFFLLFLTMLDFVYGWSLLNPTVTSLSNPTSRFLVQMLPLGAWACLWLAVGVVCLVHAFRFNDAAGFAAAMALKVLWGLLFLFGWFLADVERGYLSAAIWLAFAGLMALVVPWPDDLKVAARVAAARQTAESPMDRP